MEPIPVIGLPACSFGPLGITVGQDVDHGGGCEPAAVVIPVIAVNVDERDTCQHVQAFLHEDKSTDPETCYSYSAGMCSRRAPGLPCAFLEPADAPVWQRARRWRPWRDGLLFVGESNSAVTDALNDEGAQ